MDKRFIDQCEREQLHLSAAIQPHGTLLIVDAAGRLTHWAANVGDFLGAAFVPTANELPAALHQSLLELGERPGSRLHCLGLLNGPAGLHDVVFTRNDQGDVLIEIFPGCAEPLPPPMIHDGVNAPPGEAELTELRETLVGKVLRRSGFQRVMYYQFRDDGDGEVLVEQCQAGVCGTYLGLRFPASDIPRIARTLYQLNPWRLIPDASAAAVPLLGQADAALADLTYSDLRSVSPVHAVYLANMGVRASLSFPIIVGNQLAGLIACHHAESCLPPLGQLLAIAQKVRAHSMTLTAYIAQRRIQLVDGLVRRFTAARDIVHGRGDLLAAWPELAAWLADEFAADGAVLCIDDQALQYGTGLEPEALAVIDDWFVAGQTEQVWLADSLIRQVPGFPCSEIAGVLATRATSPAGRPIRVYLTRREHVHEVAWGGNPDKPVEHHDGQLGIAPRRSFEKWVEKRLGRCRPWDNEARLLGLKLRELLMQFRHDV